MTGETATREQPSARAPLLLRHQCGGPRRIVGGFDESGEAAREQEDRELAARVAVQRVMQARNRADEEAAKPEAQLIRELQAEVCRLKAHEPAPVGQ